jgi:hypothetical protein
MTVGVYSSSVLCVAIVTKDSTVTFDSSLLDVLPWDEKSWSCATASKPFE